MARRNVYTSLGIFVCCLMAIAGVASADTMQVTGGGPTLSPTAASRHLSRDDGFTPTGVAYTSGTGQQAICTFTPFCSPGGTLDRLVNEERDENGKSNGHHHSGGFGSSGSAPGPFAGSAMRPPLAPVATMAGPYLFSGVFSGNAGANSNRPTFAGGGPVKVVFLPQSPAGSNAVNVPHIMFNADPITPLAADPAVAATPEPATLALLGGGLVAAYYRRRRAQR